MTPDARVWRLGIFDLSDALVIRGVVRNRFLGWDQVLLADVDAVPMGFRTELDAKPTAGAS